MFGGMRFNKNSEFLREADGGKSNAGASGGTVNDGLFQMVMEAENHAKQIIRNGQSQYVDGIKQNILDLIRLWLREGSGNAYALYGKMGCGKSFFSARLYEKMSLEKERWDVVAFSSQQIYRDTANVRNMLISLAHQLFAAVPACGQYFARHPLDSESISGLTEDVLVSAFEGVQLNKPVLVIIDGLDEYPRQDCEVFLETLGRLRTRLNPRVRIFFTSRPEEYIMSEMLCQSEDCLYHIEKNEDQSHADCLRFVDVKCQKSGIHIEDALKEELIEKSECSLKYLECFFNDIACGSIQVTADFIDSLPMGLSHYYRDQLVRYFGDEGLRYYQSKIVPLLELLCVAWRPITIEEAADILGCREADINQIISRSGTLLWRNNRYVMLYQSESIREFLMDERYCPEKYRIDSLNGNERILGRLQEMMDQEEDLENNMYLFACAVDHITERERITTADWALLVRMVACYAHKADVMFKISRKLINKTGRQIVAFLRCLMADREISTLLQDSVCVRLIAAAIEEKQTDKILAVIDMVEGQEAFDFLVNYGRGRVYRNLGKPEEALACLQQGLRESEDVEYRPTYYIDEICRIHRRLGDITWEEMTDLHIQVLQKSEEIVRRYQRRGGPGYLVLQRSVSVSYDQLARLCELLEKETDPSLRQSCGSKLQEALQLPDTNFSRPGWFLQAAEACYQAGLRLSKLCQQHDTYSDSRIYDLHYSFYALGILYFRKDFPGYNREKALQYFEDGLNSIMEIAQRPESHERYLQVPIKLYRRLVEICTGEKDFASARKYLAEGIRMRDMQLLYRPGAKAEFDRCYGYEQEADLVWEEKGIQAAESYYLAAARHYEASAKKYTDLSLQRAAQIVYYKIAKKYKQVGNLEKFVDFSWLELDTTKKTYALYGENSDLWDLAVTQEQIADAMRDMDEKKDRQQRIALIKSAVQSYLELAEKDPRKEKYQIAPCVIYYNLCQEYCEMGLLEEARDAMEKGLVICRMVAQRYPHRAAWVDMPLWMFIKLQNILPDEESYQQYREKCEDFIAFADQYCTGQEYQRAKWVFRWYVADHVRLNQGAEAAEPLYMTFCETSVDYARQYLNEEAAACAYSGYAELMESFKSKEKKIYYGQKALETADELLGLLPSSTKLRRKQNGMYGILADILKDSSDDEEVATAADLYILRLQKTLRLASELEDGEEKKSAEETVGNAYEALMRFLREQEWLVKRAIAISADNKPLLRKYVQIIIHVYTFLAKANQPEAEEKLAYYAELKSRLEEEG